MIVSDSTALIAFARIEHLDILEAVLQTLTIPPAVNEEIAIPGEPGAQTVEQAPWIHTWEIEDRTFLERLPRNLDPGEREAVALAKELGATLLSDDKPARTAAQAYDIPVTGTLAVLARAKEDGVISSGKALLDQMLEHDFRLSERLYRHFLADLGELDEE